MNLVLIVLDSLRQDHVACYGKPPWYESAIQTPNLDGFAAEAVRFDNAYPEALPTIPVRTALVTGQRTLQGRPWQPLAPEDVTAAEIFAELGYVNAMITDVYHLAKPGMNFARGFHSFKFIRGQESDAFETTPHGRNVDDFIHPAMKGTTKETVVDQYLRNVAAWKSDEDCFPAQVFKEAARFVEGVGNKPFFMWVDSFDPHEPWYPLPPFDKLYVDPHYKGPHLIDALYSTVDYMSADELAFIRAMYAGEATMTDKWFGFFIDALRARKLLDNTLVLVLADHGHPLGDHRKIMKHPDNLYGELLRIPFLLRLAGAEHAGKQLDALAQTDDVLPTFLDYIDCGAEAVAMHGKSLRPLVEGRAESVRDWVVTGYHQSPYRCVRDRQWSYFYRPEGSELYNLANDPTEQCNVIGQHVDVAERMHRRMGVFSFTKQGKAPGKNIQERYEWSGTPVALDRNPAVARR